jgi:hypothetical protein
MLSLWLFQGLCKLIPADTRSFSADLKALRAYSLRACSAYIKCLIFRVFQFENLLIHCGIALRLRTFAGNKNSSRRYAQIFRRFKSPQGFSLSLSKT